MVQLPSAPSDSGNSRSTSAALLLRDLQHHAGFAGHGVGGGVDVADLVHPPHRNHDLAIDAGSGRRPDRYCRPAAPARSGVRWRACRSRRLPRSSPGAAPAASGRETDRAPRSHRARYRPASVTAYLSPTMARKRAISSGESGVRAACTMFIGLVSFFVFFVILPADRGAAQPVVDGLAEAVMRHRHDGDGARASGVERAKIAEKIGGGLGEIAARGQIHHGCRRVDPGQRPGRTPAAPRRARRWRH